MPAESQDTKMTPIYTQNKAEKEKIKSTISQDYGISSEFVVEQAATSFIKVKEDSNNPLQLFYLFDTF